MPIVRVDDSGKKKNRSKKIAALVLIGFTAGIGVLYCLDERAGTLISLCSVAFGTVWSLADD